MTSFTTGDGVTADPDQMAARFVEARRTGSRLPLPRSERLYDIEAAYSVQQRFREQYCLVGDRTLVGYKLAATGTQSQARLGIAEPVVGMLFSDEVVRSPAMLRREAFYSPVAEAKIAFVVREDLPELCSREELIASCDVAPAIELADCRYPGWPVRAADISAQDIVLDNAFSGTLVLGARVPATTIDLAAVVASLAVGQRVVGSAGGSLRPTDPAASVGWLSRTLHRLGGRLTRGIVVATGMLAGPLVADNGAMRAVVDEIGGVTVQLLGSGEPDHLD